ncbi:MAG: hypothetical protein J0I09_09140 [Sphingobacteriia bacterium]|nr:hypothetical protein [Sphingobacteriia bacterium]
MIRRNKTTERIMIVIILFFFSTIRSYSQSNSNQCNLDCGIDINTLLAMRCPDEDAVARKNNLTISEISFKNNDQTIVLGGVHCGDKAAALLKKYRDEDNKTARELKSRYCYALQGWENIKDCEHGGPPPCCPHPLSDGIWRKVSPEEAIQNFKAQQAKLYEQRMKEIADLVKPCQIAAIQENNQQRESYAKTFNTDWEVVSKNLIQLSKTNPTEATKLINEANVIHNEFQVELNKNMQANMQNLKDLTVKLRKIDDGINLVTAKQTPPKQQFSQANLSIPNSNTKQNMANNEFAQNNQAQTISTVDLNKPYYDNAAAVQRTLNANAPIMQSTTDLIDKYLVDKAKLAENPLLAASYEYSKKAALASNYQEQKTYNITSGVLGLMSLAGSNKTKNTLSKEEAKEKQSIMMKQLRPERAHYIYINACD